MTTLEKRVSDLEKGQRAGPPVFAVIDSLDKSESEIQDEIDAAYARHPGKNVNIFILRYEGETHG